MPVIPTTLVPRAGTETVVTTPVSKPVTVAFLGSSLGFPKTKYEAPSGGTTPEVITALAEVIGSAAASHENSIRGVPPSLPKADFALANTGLSEVTKIVYSPSRSSVIGKSFTVPGSIVPVRTAPNTSALEETICTVTSAPVGANTRTLCPASAIASVTAT